MLRTDPHAFLLSLGVDTVPHATNAPKRLEDMTPETLLAEGSFFDHLVGNEGVVREWQKAEPGRYSDAIALAALYHSIYGTAGFQGESVEQPSRCVLYLDPPCGTVY
jgi:hypothetical protein